MAGDEKVKGAEEAPTKSKKKLMIVVAAVLVALIGGGVGGYVMLAPAKAGAEPAPVPGVVVPLEAVTMNLADGHYLKLTMTLQATDKALEEPDGSKALDIAISLFSNVDKTEISNTEGREKFKKQLTEKIIEAYTKDEDGEKVKEIMDVYFKTFVIQ